MNKYGKMRAIVIQSGRQKRRAAIYTNASAEELDAQRVVRSMCRRWEEENQIKELLLKHMINYMPGYVTEGLDELPAQVRFDEAHDGKKLMALNYEKKRFLDCIKVFTCNVTESYMSGSGASGIRKSTMPPGVSVRTSTR